MQSNIILQGITLDEFIRLVTGIIKDEISRSDKLAQNSSTEHKLLTTKEAAEILGIAEITIHKMKKNGKIIPVYIGKSVRYPQSEIERLSNNTPLERKKDTFHNTGNKLKSKQ